MQIAWLLLAAASVGVGAVLVNRWVTIWLHNQHEVALKRQDVKQMEANVAASERQAKLRLDEDTYEERLALEKAELARRASEEHARADLINSTHDERRAAEVRVIEARANAQCEAAPEFARAENEAGTEQVFSVEEVVEAYDDYLRSVEDFTSVIGVADIGEFVDIMKRAAS